MQNFKKGFTLIELLVVVAIIGVLTALLLVNMVGIRERGADSKKKSDLNQLKNALRLYYNDHQAYPAATTCGASTCFIACNGAACGEGAEMNDGAGTVYMQSVPEYTSYWVSGDTDSFYVGVSLSNLSDPEIEASIQKCNVFSAETTDLYYVCSD